MESEMSVNGDTTSAWNSVTNWTTVRGTLVNSITFETSFSPSQSHIDVDINPTAKRRPLILKPTAPDSGPCEITISFTQKHELGQIYVKSTARVYEIYCTSELQSDREYLCTVRCGAAARDDDDDEESLSSYSNGSRDNPSKENSGNESNRSTSEDEWFEVKVPNPSLALIKPEYHEATAQMSDMNPCLSITIRLLSIQSKDIVVIDEVYVFADPVETIESESQVARMNNSTGNSVMAMLMPTLLQMSKTKGSTRIEDKSAFENWKKHESASEAACSSSANVATRAQNDGSSNTDNDQKVEFPSVNLAGVNGTELQGPPQVSLGKSKVGDCPTNDRVEKGLDQLFARMGRLEDLLLRLEENLLKPIDSIEARLDRVEQQLEVLTNKQKSSELPSYSRFCAPNFSSIHSDSNSFYRSEIEYPRLEEFELNTKSIHSDLQTNQADEVSDDANATQMLPTLVVTAPNFSNCDDDDDEEENQTSETVTETSVEEVRRPLTVDDALASALAGLVSSISIQAQNHTPVLSVKAPDFPNDEDTNDNKKDSPRGQPDILTDGTGSENGSISNVSRPSIDGKMIVVKSLHCDQSEKTTEKDDVQSKQYEEGDEDESSTKSIDKNEDIDNEKLNAEGNEDLFHDKTDVQDVLIRSQMDPIGADTRPTDAKSCSDSASAVETSEDGSKDKEGNALRDIMVLSQAVSSAVDFESPVLDVKFLSEDSQECNFSLEALLSDLPKSLLEEATCAEGKNHETAPSFDEHSELISVEHGEPIGPAFSSQIVVDFDYCSLQDQEPLHNEDGTPQLAPNDIPCSHENFPPSLI